MKERTRDRTQEVLVASNPAYTITLHFKRPNVYDRDTVVIETSDFLGDDRHYVQVLAGGLNNLYQFQSFHSMLEMRFLLCLLERHEEKISQALTE